MTPLRCSQVRDMAPDVALGLLTGKERADALAHLEGCAACRAEVTSLAGVADEVLLTAPEATPPAGFDQRVLARLAELRRVTPAPLPPRRHGLARLRRRRAHDRSRVAVGAALVAAAAAVILVAAVLVTRDDGGAPTETAEMSTGVGEVVGTATVRSGDPATVAIDVPGWQDKVRPGATYWLAIELDDGSRTLTRLGTDDDWWEVPLQGAADQVATVSVLDGDGMVWCSAAFPA